MHALLILFAATAPTLRLPDNARPTRYTVELTVDPLKEELSGAVDLELQVRQPLDVLWLNATDLKITKAPGPVLPGGKDFVGIQVKLAAGAAKVHLEWTAPLSSKDSRAASRQKEGDDWYVFTHFEPIDARRVFPCFDEPGYKAPWKLAIKVKKRDAAFTNTPQLSEKIDGDWKRVQFAESKPLPSYLVAFAVGPIEAVDGGKVKNTPVRILVPRGQSERARWAAESSRQSLERLEEYFGSEYPYGKLDVISVPLFGGAMEHPGLVTFNSSIILQKPADETIDRKRAYAEIATHEFAHQWFGDLVTTAWWDDLWLNEAFATWMTPKIVAAWQPTWGAAEDRVNTRAGAIAADSLVSARKIRQPITSNDDMANAFDGITYSKGATVIGMFERFVGPELFRKGVQRYLKEHAHGNATAADFLKAISTEAGRDIAPAFSTFLDQPGVPIVSFDLVCNKTPHLHMTQQRYLPKGSPGGGENQLWQIPICVRFPGGSSCTLLEKREGDLPLQSCPAWVMPNDGGTAYYRALPSAALLTQLENAAAKELTPPEKLALISDMNGLVRAGKLELSSLMELAPRLAGDPNRFVVQNLAGTVGWLRDGELVAPAQRPLYAKYIRELFGARAQKLGWVSKKGEDEDTRILRSRLVPLVADVGEDQKLIDEAKKLATAWLADHKAVDPDMVDEVLEMAAQHGDRTLYDKWLAAARAEKDRAERRRLLGALSTFRDPKIVADSLAVVLTDAFEPREAIWLFWGATRDPGTRKLAWKWMLEHFDALVAKLPRDSAARFPYVATGACDDALAPETRTFFAERAKKFEGGPRHLEQALEQMHLCAVFKQSQAPSVARFLGEEKMSIARTAEKLRKIALTYPGTYEESPWGDRVVKVKGKIFLFCGEHEKQLYLSVKLPKSGREVLKNAWAKPTAYGLGKSGWVSAHFEKTDKLPEAAIADWIDESYRALAPKKLLAQLDEPVAPAKKVAPQKTKKLAHRVLLLCEDELRSERARAALAKQGVTADSVDSVKKVRAALKKLDAVIIDLGRSQDDGLELAREIDGSDHPIHLFIAGIRDARADKRAQEAATSADRFREPPGDVAAAIAATLSAHKPRKR